jgi:3-mercaptopyruvate sulfurtransferase SseA
MAPWDVFLNLFSLFAQVRSRSDMLSNIASKAEVVVDARSAGRFIGTEPEPRAGLRGGHIPGSVCELTSGPRGK